jgi:hypothetical protein
MGAGQHLAAQAKAHHGLAGCHRLAEQVASRSQIGVVREIINIHSAATGNQDIKIFDRWYRLSQIETVNLKSGPSQSGPIDCGASINRPGELQDGHPDIDHK